MDVYFGSDLKLPEERYQSGSIVIVPQEILKNRLQCQYAVQTVDIDDNKATI